MFIDLIHTNGDVSKPAREDVVKIIKSAKMLDTALNHLNGNDAGSLVELINREMNGANLVRQEAYGIVRETILNYVKDLNTR